MTEQETIEDVLRRMREVGGWYIDRVAGGIRRKGATGEVEDPLVAGTGWPMHQYQHTIKAYGYDHATIRRIADAADYRQDDNELRERLLEAAGLK